MTSHVTLRQELNKQKQWIVLGEKKNVIKTIGLSLVSACVSQYVCLSLPGVAQNAPTKSSLSAIFMVQFLILRVGVVEDAADNQDLA